MTLQRFKLDDGTVVRGAVNTKGWLEWVLKEKDPNGFETSVTTGLSRPGSFSKVEKGKR